MKNTKIFKLIISSLCVAIGIVLPIAFHAVPNAGSMFLPMHIPVLLCGLICGPFYGLACGILAPLLSCLLTGMPPLAFLPSMLCELAVYGIVAGILFKVVKTKNKQVNTYISLIGAMLCGRLAGGMLNALIFSAGKYSMHIWLTSSFVTALPGIMAQLVFIPLIIFALQKAKLIDDSCLPSKALKECKI
ncbi:MAG: ECF transporter S component [Eubacteriales bacterium]